MRWVGVTLAVVLGLAPGVVAAQDMNLALSRLSTEPGCTAGCVADGESWQRLITQLAGGAVLPMLTPAATGGPRSFEIGLETSFVGIANGQGYWSLGVEGAQAGVERAASVDSVLTWGRVVVRKGLPFGLSVGGSVGHQLRTSYVALGVEARWALFEGFRDGLGVLPDVAVRGAVQTLVGTDGFSLTMPSVGLVMSKPVVIGRTVELSPFLSGEWVFVVADSGLIDLSPETGAFGDCSPNPAVPSPPQCTGAGAEQASNVVFPRVRSSRWRASAGLRLRVQAVMLSAAFAFDVVRPSDADTSLPGDLDRQWQVQVGAGLAL